MEQIKPVMKPPAGTRVQCFVGDRVRFGLADSEGQPIPSGWSARLRTNLGRGEVLCKEIIQAHARKLPPADASWHDLAMRPGPEEWTLELPLAEPGWYRAKPYFIDGQGWQHWPEGPDICISVHPDHCRTANTIYCAFTRMFGETRTERTTENEELAAQFKKLDAQGYSVIPPSGKFRDLIRQLPHIVDTLGCRILLLLPVNPVPTTYARFGRFGSPYASLDLTGIDPALVEFDRRTTGVDQFCELARAVHLKDARLFLDIVINHTGWGSRLEEDHPEWFVRGSDGRFASPGAWGVTWEDLVELEHCRVELWDLVAESLLVWCRRGVDGFRCDAGYKVPLPAWKYITARVRQEFPETVFLLEGLGGAWEVTESLLGDGGMQWAYSELFQNYSALQVSGYLDHALRQNGHTGLLVHFSETHDNERLSQRGRLWSLLRNRLCALASVSGGFGFTCGVEWLAPERLNVHSSRGLAWGSPENIIPELARLNELLANHPCFFDQAALKRLSPADSPVYALRRDSAEGADSVLVLVNTDDEKPRSLALPAGAFEGWGDARFELLGQPVIKPAAGKDGGLEFTLAPGACYCLSPSSEPRGISGAKYRRMRTQAAWAATALSKVLAVESIPPIDWRELSLSVDKNPARFLAAASTLAARPAAATSALPDVDDSYQPVVTWTLADATRVSLVPPGHWLLIRDSVPFRVCVEFHAGDRPEHSVSIPVSDGHVACLPPGLPPGDARLNLERSASANRTTRAAVRILEAGPVLESGAGKPLSLSNTDVFRQVATNVADAGADTDKIQPLAQPLVLLTNGLGGMARMCVDLGAIKSKYDCLLAANLHPSVPVDRHVLAKRARVWINADGFISPLDLRSLASFEPGPPAVWHFGANAGDGRTVDVNLTAAMVPGSNTTVLCFERPVANPTTGRPLPDNCDVRLTVRVDIEDRSFHWETKRNGGSEYHFTSHTRPLDRQPGFIFAPAADRALRVFADSGQYHDQAEWSENIPHPVEQSRGQAGSGDAWSPGWFDLPLRRGEGVTLVVTADATDPAPEKLSQALLPRETSLPGMDMPNPLPPDDPFGRQLFRAAQDFVVRRDSGITVIAGYPWFLDWGRDSLISARGLLAAGMIDQVKQLLVIFGRFARDGTLPNTIHGEDASNRDTTDAPLWYGIVCEEAAAITGPQLYQTKTGDAGNTIGDVLAGIAVNYCRGTPNGIRMDAESGLIWSPSHFTWMDTNYPAATPREGYPVEIQVLWIRLLRQIERNKLQPDTARWRDLADRAEASLKKYFWLEDRGWLADLLAARAGQPAAGAAVDDALRSNCLFAISLGLLSGAAARRCVSAAARHLVVPGGLRSLAPLPVSLPLPVYGQGGRLLNRPSEPYFGRYEGDEDTSRKPAYHNGTAWVWTFPAFCEALALAWDFSPEAVAAARAYLGSMDRLLVEGCVGQLPEILDGDAPHFQRGCDAQAWSVTEALRVWKLLRDAAPRTGR
jgi:starch synthase (maltosyl-transferring)